MTLSYPQDPLKSEWPLFAIATFSFCALWLWQANASTGFLEADACTHYLIAKYAFAEPYRFADVWGRPFKTLLFSVPAVTLGRVGVRGVSLALALLTAFVAMLLARDAGVRRPAIAYLFTLAVPLLFLHSFSELTELPFTALLATAYYAWSHGRLRTCAFLAAMLPLARPEGFPLLALLAVLLVLRLRSADRSLVLAALALLPWALIAWSLFGWQTSGHDGNPLTWIPRHWPYSGDSVYTAHVSPAEKLFHLFKFTLSLPAVTGPFVFPAFLLGAAVAFSRRAFSLLAIPALILVGHSLLYFLGKMGSNGEMRYMLIAAPFWGTLAALGWDRATAWLARPWPESLRFACYAAILPLLVSMRGYNVLPVEFDDSWQTTRQVALFADRLSRQTNHPAIMSAHPGVYYFLGRSNMDATRSHEFTLANVQHPPPGTILLFDPVYAQFNADRARVVDGPDAIERAGWIPYPQSLVPRSFWTDKNREYDRWRAYLSPN